MNLWLIQSLNSLALGGVLFILAAGFSLIFGLMRIPNLMHGSFFMLGAYLGVSLLAGFNVKLGSLAFAESFEIENRTSRETVNFIKQEPLRLD